MKCIGVELGSVTCGHDCTAEDQAYIMQRVCLNALNAMLRVTV